MENIENQTDPISDPTQDPTPDPLDIRAIAHSIRAIRRQKGMTLKDVEAQSQGRWKAVVVGSYERCDRALTLNRAIELANFYQVPLDQLLGLRTDREVADQNLRLNIKGANARASNDPLERAFQNFVLLICGRRHDWNGVMLSVRKSDLMVLALLMNRSEKGTYEWLQAKKLLI